MEKRNLTFTSDPGHGWLSVSLKDLKTMGITSEISSHSYMTTSRAYLEEDRDAGIFLKAAKNQGWEINIKETSVDKTPIRSFASFSEKKLDWALELDVGSEVSLYNSSTKLYSNKAKISEIDGNKIKLHCENGNNYRLSKSNILKYVETVEKKSTPKP